jgi:pimeloyl-ACP methyl ester carboxylesterase
MGGERANGELLARQGHVVATNVTSVILADTGHWLMEERPAQTAAALEKFLGS